MFPERERDSRAASTAALVASSADACSSPAPGVPVVEPFFFGVMVVPFASSRQTSALAAVPAVLPSWVPLPATVLNR